MEGVGSNGASSSSSAPASDTIRTTMATNTPDTEPQHAAKRARLNGDEAQSQSHHQLEQPVEEDEQQVDLSSLPHWRRAIGNDFSLYRTCIDMISRFPRRSLKHWDVTWHRYNHLPMKRRNLKGMKHDIIEAVLKARNMSDEAIPSSFFDSSLEELCLAGGARLTSTKLNHIARHCRNLIRLDLRGCFYLDNNGLDNILQQCQKLKYIGIQGCRKLSNTAVNSLCNHEHLEGIDIGGCYNISGDIIRHLISHHPNRQHFTELGVSGAAASNDELAELITEKMANLETLRLGYFEGSDKGIDILSKQLGRLKYLQVHWSNSITDNALLTLGRNAVKLECLDITGCEAFTPEGIQNFLSMRTPLPNSDEESENKNLQKLVAPFAPIDTAFQTFVSESYPILTLQVNP
eukprot:gb/GECG01013449.1/.p1 GENE.gb/GECG01013449.1/~~gb/GECG01013449.1/.p1  ORF type:complete len:405 (+),score=49.17 gb/GECG01013449.1/:1-1215(+)